MKNKTKSFKTIQVTISPELDAKLKRLASGQVLQVAPPATPQKDVTVQFKQVGSMTVQGLGGGLRSLNASAVKDLTIHEGRGGYHIQGRAEKWVSQDTTRFIVSGQLYPCEVATLRAAVEASGLQRSVFIANAVRKAIGLTPVDSAKAARKFLRPAQAQAAA